MEEKNINEKWEELLTYATKHATGKGMPTGIAWLRDSFNEYLDMSDNTPGYGMGGQPGSEHNRRVLAGRIVLKLGNGVGGRHVLSEYELYKLKNSLENIVASQSRNNGLKL